MKNAMIKLTTKATAAMLVAAIVFTTVAPPVYAAENTAVVAEVQEGVGEEQGSVLDIVVDTAVGIGTTDKDSGWTRILNYIIDSIFG